MLPLLIGIVWLGLYPGARAPANGSRDAAVRRGRQPAPDGPMHGVRLGASPEGSAMNSFDLCTPIGITLALLPEILLIALVADRPAGGRAGDTRPRRTAGWPAG